MFRAARWNRVGHNGTGRVEAVGEVQKWLWIFSCFENMINMMRAMESQFRRYRHAYANICQQIIFTQDNSISVPIHDSQSRNFSQGDH